MNRNSTVTVPEPIPRGENAGPTAAVSEMPADRPETAVQARRATTAGSRPARRRSRGSTAVDRGSRPGAGVPSSTPTHIADLTTDPANRRKHNPRNLGMVVDALHRVGAARSIVIDEDGVVLAGNGTIEAAAEAGITRLQVVDADGETLVAVRRTGLTREQKRALALYDNRAAELAGWDLVQLRADADAGLDLGTFFQPAELADLLGADAPVPDFAEIAAADVPRLDQLRPVTCPHCGGEIDREALR